MIVVISSRQEKKIPITETEIIAGNSQSWPYYLNRQNTTDRVDRRRRWEGEEEEEDNN